MNRQKIALVLRREYGFNFKRPAFLFTAFGVPLISFVAMFLLTRFIIERETNLDDWQRVAYIDRAGIVDENLVIPDECGCNYTPATAPEGDDYDERLAAATQQIQDGTLDAFFVIAENYRLSGQIDLYAKKNVPDALNDNITSFMWHQISASAPDTLAVPTDRLGNNDYTIRDLDTGEALSEAALAGRFVLPMLFVFLYFMATNTTAQYLMSGVVEEKENRLMEILATSLKPLELLWGKLLGLGSLALTQVALWVSAGLLISQLNADAQDFLSGMTFKAGDLVLIAFLFLINFLLFSAAMLGIGASVTADTESRQIAGIFTFINVLPIMALVAFISNPNGPIPLFFTFFPFSAATGLILRMGLTHVPLWQMLLSIAIQIVSVIAVMWLGAKAFRLGMLMYGKPLTPRTLWRALREGRTTMTTASTAYDSGQAKNKEKSRKKRWGLL